jgi:hypothetical protein
MQFTVVGVCSLTIMDPAGRRGGVQVTAQKARSYALYASALLREPLVGSPANPSSL